MGVRDEQPVRSRYVMSYTGRFQFPVSPSELWAAMERTDQYERWWGWLGSLRMDGDGLCPGSVLTGTVDPPVPYRMQVAVEVGRCVPGRVIDANVTGDLVGPARIRFRPAADGTTAEASWSLEMMQLPMRVAARVAYPVLRWGHDRVVEATVSGFRKQLRPSGDVA